MQIRENCVITEHPERCLAFLKSGERCRNKGRPEFDGLCGTHRKRVPVKGATPVSVAPANPPATEVRSVGRIEKIGKIVGLATSLVVLFEKSAAHFPQLVEVITHISRIAFVAESIEGLESLEAQDEIGVKVAVRDIIDGIKRCAPEEREWPRLMVYLQDFDNWVYDPADLPDDLLAGLKAARSNLLRELRSMGVAALSDRLPRATRRRL